MGGGIHKTTKVESAMFISRAENFLALSSLRKKNLMIAKYWESIPEALKKNPIRGDKQSNWWQITPRGIAHLADVYGKDIINDEDQKQLAKFYLRNEKILKTSAWRTRHSGKQHSIDV